MLMNDTQKPTGYLAIPPSGAGPGVLVLHAWWGLNDTIKDVCDRLAGAGFVAYAPDLFNGRIAQTIPEAEQLSGEADGLSEAILANIAAAVDHLWQRAQPRDHGLGVIGFSFGAYYALQLSASDPERVSAVVLFYGCGDGDFDKARATYLGHFAEDDPYEPAENVDWLENALRENGRVATFYRYEGVGHWFFEPDRVDAHDETAANLAWERTLTFLNKTLPS
jgi:carboxymethylenebutenolidase